MGIKVNTGHETDACRKAGQDLLKEAKQDRENKRQACNGKIDDLMKDVGGYLRRKSRTDEFLVFSGLGERKPLKCDECGHETFSGKITATTGGLKSVCRRCEKDLRDGLALTKPKIGIKVNGRMS